MKGFTIDRINTLCMLYGIVGITSKEAKLTPLHDVLNRLDLAAGMDTRGGTLQKTHNHIPIPINLVGARLARHERHYEYTTQCERRYKAPFFHWLGAAAEAA